MTQKRKTYDWEKIETQYRANVLSIRQVAREHGIAEGTIRNRAKKYNWVRDLSDKVKRRAQGKIATSDRYSPEDEEKIIEDAAQEITNVVLSHRKDLSNLRDLEEDLIARAKKDGDLPTNSEIKAMQADLERKIQQGDDISDIVMPEGCQELSIKDRAMTLDRLTNVRIKRIEAERKAYNMDGGREDEQVDMTEAEIDAEINALEE